MEYLRSMWGHLQGFGESVQFMFGDFFNKIIDVVEIILLAFLIYHILMWVKKSRAMILLKGVALIGGVLLIAYVLKMNTILWIASKGFTIAVIAILIIMQPELRKVLETLGKSDVFEKLKLIDTRRETGRFTDKTLQGILNSCASMGKEKTGALIVLERNQSLNDYINTGIAIDALVSNQLIINIFEHNTPLHDGAVVIKGDRIAAATCYLPLSENREVNKALGTRHRAALGASENTDALIVVVSEETGFISVARDGVLYSNIGVDGLQEHLVQFQEKRVEEPEVKRTIMNRWKGTK